MSTRAKIALGASLVATIGVIVGVHASKHLERQKLRQGVYKDIERQERKKRNLEDLKQQIELTKVLTQERDKREREEALTSTLNKQQ